MRFSFQIATLFLALFAAESTGCTSPEGSGMLPSGGRSLESVTERISVVQTQTVALDPGRRAVIRFKVSSLLKGKENEPVVSRRVSFALLDDVNGSTLINADAVSDTEGVVRATVQAGMSAARFRLRALTEFSEPAFVTVSVADAELGRTLLQLENFAIAEPANVAISLFEGLQCADGIGSLVPDRELFLAGGVSEVLLVNLSPTVETAILVESQDDEGTLIGRGCAEWSPGPDTAEELLIEVLSTARLRNEVSELGSFAITPNKLPHISETKYVSAATIFELIETASRRSARADASPSVAESINRFFSDQEQEAIEVLDELRITQSSFEMHFSNYIEEQLFPIEAEVEFVARAGQPPSMSLSLIPEQNSAWTGVRIEDAQVEGADASWRFKDDLKGSGIGSVLVHLATNFSLDRTENTECLAIQTIWPASDECDSLCFLDICHAGMQEDFLRVIQSFYNESNSVVLTPQLDLFLADETQDGYLDSLAGGTFELEMTTPFDQSEIASGLWRTH